MSYDNPDMPESVQINVDKFEARHGESAFQIFMDDLHEYTSDASGTYVLDNCVDEFYAMNMSAEHDSYRQQTNFSGYLYIGKYCYYFDIRSGVSHGTEIDEFHQEGLVTDDIAFAKLVLGVPVVEAIVSEAAFCQVSKPYKSHRYNFELEQLFYASAVDFNTRLHTPNSVVKTWTVRFKDDTWVFIPLIKTKQEDNQPPLIYLNTETGDTWINSNPCCEIPISEPSSPWVFNGSSFVEKEPEEMDGVVYKVHSTAKPIAKPKHIYKLHVEADDDI